MSLRSKVFLVIGTLLVVLFFLMNQVLSYIVSRDFAELEQREGEKNSYRVIDALQDKVDGLSIKLGDWAQWDDTYQFMIDHNEEYIQSNLQDEAFSLLQMNAVALLDTTGHIVFKKYVEDGKEGIFPESFAQHLTGDAIDEYEEQLQGIHKEIISLPEGALISVTRPITSSDGLAPTNGFIIFAYFLNQSVVADLSRITHLEIQASLYTDQSLQGEFSDVWRRLSREHPFFIEVPKDSKTIISDVFVGDDHGNPVLLLRVLMDREIYQNGQEGLTLFTRLMAVAALAFSVLIFFLLDRLVLRKLSSLSSQVEKIGESGSTHTAIILPGQDEFSRLAVGINDMLQTLSQAEIKRKESERRFRTVADSAPVMIWISDVERKCTYVNKVWLDFTGRALEQELGLGWTEGVHPDDLKSVQLMYGEASLRQQPFHVEYRLRGVDGKYVWVFSRATPNISPEGSFLGYIGSCVDITERKEAEIQKQDYIAGIENMNRLMVERELKMVELKEKIKKLEGQA